MQTPVSNSEIMRPKQPNFKRFLLRWQGVTGWEGGMEETWELWWRELDIR